MIDAELRSFEITTPKGDFIDSNRQIWQSLKIKQGDSALFFPAPNALVPIQFAKYMNKRKVTFVDTSEVNVSTLISLAAQLKLANTTVKLASKAGKFPIADSAFDIVYSDLGFSTMYSEHKVEPDLLTKELSRIAKPGGKIVALEENGAPVMYPCPPEVQVIRAKLDSSKAEGLTMGRRLFSTFKSNSLKNIKLGAYSRFLTSDEPEKLRAEIARRLSSLDANVGQKLGASIQEVEKYRSWLASQSKGNNWPFMMQFNMILAVAEK